MLAFSVTSNALAQINEGGHRTLFRPTNVMSAEDVDKGVNHFETGKWYQLVNEEGKLLVQYRHLAYVGDASNALILKLENRVVFLSTILYGQLRYLKMGVVGKTLYLSIKKQIWNWSMGM